MKYMLSNGIWATKVEDFEDVLNYNDFNALVDIVNQPDTSGTDWKQAYIEEELHSDSLYQRNTSAYCEIDELITYLLEAKRMNKAKILDKLREIQNTLQNY